MPKYHQSSKNSRHNRFSGTNQLNLIASPFYKEKPTKHRMPSTRRIKVFGLLVFIGVITLLFYTSSARQQRNALSGDFYAKTKNALDNKQTQGKGEIAQAQGLRNAEDEELAKQMQERLKDAAKSAKDAANAKAPKPDPPSQIVGVGSAAEGAGAERSVAGRKKMGGGDKGTQEVVKEESKEDSDINAELNSILKKSAIIIFSKSFCPHSKRAKEILLDKYSIDPAPFVVELDQHPLGAKLQARLAELTGRKTVPNVLINGVSIGGGDDVAELDSKKTLIDQVKDLGGSKILSAKLKEVTEGAGSHALR
ncbi:glutaredoxin protein [Rutstroemia sp. NJR-2017a WRK4]|nr:glutaredoxin protein [Rutstroemia sp. NJR-2017a WRK4]